MTKYDGQDRRNKERWKLNKEVSLGDLFAFGAAFCSVVYAYTTLDKRLSLVEQAQHAQDEDTIRYQARVDAYLTVINNKLDRIIEKTTR